MMWNTLKIFFRSLKRKKTESVITVGGYAVSMAVILLLVTYIVEEKNVNRCFTNADNIYRLKLGMAAAVPQSLADDVKGNVPGVVKMCMYSIHESLYQFEETKETAKYLAVNDDFFDMFSFRFIYQSSDPTLAIKNNILLTKSFSGKLYGDINPVGRVLQSEQGDYNIAGVITDPPQNSSFRFDIVTGLETAIFKNYRGSKKNNETHIMFKSFIQLQDNADVENISTLISETAGRWKEFKGEKISLQPFRQVYFDNLTPDDLTHANVGMIYLMSGIALVILLMTIFNYANLTVSTGYDRLKEIGVKKTTGASRKNIFSQFLTESLLVCLLSLVFAVLVSFVISPVLSNISGKRIEIDSLISQPEIFIVGILIFLITSILSGIFPAIAFSGVPPLKMMDHHKGIERRNNSAGMIAVQFFITIVLIISLLFIEKQIEFVKLKDLGFDKEMMVRLNLRGNASRKSKVLKDELLTNPEIISVSASSGSPMQFTGYGVREVEVNGVKRTIEMKIIGIDKDFVNTFGLTIVKGRNIEPSDMSACLINELFYKYLGWPDFSGKELYGNKVVGVVKDFNYDNLRKEIGLLVLEKAGSAPDIMNIKILGNISENLKFIKNTYKKVEPATPFTYSFYDDWLRSMYRKEEDQAYAVKLFVVLAIIISCLGLIGMAGHNTNNRVKEIGIRKINGAKVSEIMTMLNKDFVKWVVIAFVIAVPIAWYAMHKWLENFAYKTELSWWIFALAGIMALGISLLTVSWQSWRAATRNPVEALRYE